MIISARLPIGVRLGGGFALMLLLALGMTVAAVWRLQQVGDQVHEMVVDDLKKERLASEWLAAITANGVRTFGLAVSSDPKIVHRWQTDIQGQSKRIGELTKEIEAGAMRPEAQRLLEEVGRRRSAYLAARDLVFKAKASGNDTDAMRLVDEKMAPALQSYNESIGTVLVFEREQIDRAAAVIDEHYRTGRMLLLGLGALAAIVGTLLAWHITRTITVPLSGAVAVADRVALGDLRVDTSVDGRDEVACLVTALGMMTANLNRMVAGVRQGVENIAGASEQIAGGNADLAGRTENQAVFLARTAESLQQITRTVRNTSANAMQANELVSSACDLAKEGGQAGLRMVQTMESIADSSREVVAITDVISGIAFQTNILALNAAVEAARAGESGRGFAVVAAEVRNLALRCADASKEIKHLVDRSVARVDSGRLLAGGVQHTMTDIVSAVDRVAVLIKEIATVTKEQSSGIENINRAVGSMDEVTQSNAALVEEAAAAAKSMSIESHQLAQLVAGFQLRESVLEFVHPGASPQRAEGSPSQERSLLHE